MIGSKFEMLIVPNIFTETNGNEGDFEEIHCCDTYEEAYEDMLETIKANNDSSDKEDWHYDIWEYDDDDEVINAWEFDYKGNER